MIEQVEELKNKVQAPALRQRDVLDCPQSDVKQACPCEESFALARMVVIRRERHGSAPRLHRQCVGRLSAARWNHRRDLDIAQDRFHETAPDSEDSVKLTTSFVERLNLTLLGQCLSPPRTTGLTISPNSSIRPACVESARNAMKSDGPLFDSHGAACFEPGQGSAELGGAGLGCAGG